jgi:1-acyl-sn-glycerol-3-phosphate acyltransferase
MITPKHSRWAHFIFRHYIRNLLRRRFDAVLLLGEVPQAPPDTALLLLPNHSTWWDGFFVYMLNERVFKRVFNVMMLEHKLREFPFFRRVGAYSMNQQSPKAIAETLHFTAFPHVSQNPLVAMFPQGELRPSGLRPLGYSRGVEWLLKKRSKPVAVLPLAMRCEFLGEEKPTVFLLCGRLRVVPPNAIQTAPELESEQGQLLDDLAKRIVAGEQGRDLLASRIWGSQKKMSIFAIKRL